MKIEEFSNFYRLVESMTCAGLLATLMTILLTLLIVAVLLKVAPIGNSFSKQFKYYLPSIGIVLLIIILLFKVDANSKKRQLILANQIKAGMIYYEQKEMDFEDLVNYAIIDSLDCEPNDIIQLIENFPTEFAKVYFGDSVLYPAVRITDPNSIAMIDNYYLNNLPLIKSSILNYMLSNGLDSISYGVIQDSINEFYAIEWIELMINKFDTIFTPIIIDKADKDYFDKYGLKTN